MSHKILTQGFKQIGGLQSHVTSQKVDYFQKYLILQLNSKSKTQIPSIFLPLCYVQRDLIWAPFVVARWHHSSRKHI